MLRRNFVDNASLMDDCIYIKGIKWNNTPDAPLIYTTLRVTLQALSTESCTDVFVDWGDNSQISNNWTVNGNVMYIQHSYNVNTKQIDEKFDVRIFGNRENIAICTENVSGAFYPIVGIVTGAVIPNEPNSIDSIYIPKYAVDNATINSSSLESIHVQNAKQIFFPEEVSKPIWVDTKDIPRCSEPFLCRLYGTEADQVETEGYIFDGTESLNGIGPKLYGQTLNALGANNSVSHTYTTHPDKVVKEVICNFDNVEAQYQLSDLTYLSFDPDTFTITATSSSSTNHEIDREIAIKIVYEDGTFDVDRFHVLCNYYKPCLVYGTQISIYEGKTKPIEEITYDDLLLVHNFLTGEMEYQHPFFIKKESQATQYIELRLSNGSKLKIVGHHEVYDNKNKEMITISDTNYSSLDLNDIELLGEDGNNVKIEDISLVVEKVKYSTILTSGTICYFASGVLNGAKNQNILGFTGDNKYQTIDLYNMIRNTKSEYTHKEFEDRFGKIPKYIFYGNFYDVGLRAICSYNYASDWSWESDFKQSTTGFWTMGKQPEVNENLKLVHPITFIDKDSINTKKFEEGEIITLPDTNTKWLCVVDNKEYLSGQEYEVNVGTVFRRIYE